MPSEAAFFQPFREKGGLEGQTPTFEVERGPKGFQAAQVSTESQSFFRSLYNAPQVSAERSRVCASCAGNYSGLKDEKNVPRQPACNATEDDVRELFSEYGTVRSIRLATDVFTGKCREFGFVEMEGDDAKASVTGLNGRNGGQTFARRR